ncbi:MAG: hypothetical protein KatS3mg083_118 [Candidatus Dojkabacteria bacterium]|nr:MAG: hypothetical protein KatS3mg083_118 [Candidatus Dojkabacteria bacterium]
MYVIQDINSMDDEIWLADTSVPYLIDKACEYAQLRDEVRSDKAKVGQIGDVARNVMIDVIPEAVSRNQNNNTDTKSTRIITRRLYAKIFANVV